MVNKYVKKYTVSSFGIKEKLSVALGIVIAIILYFMFFHVDKTPYGYAEIPEDVDAYMKTADNYSRFYGKGKMLIKCIMIKEIKIILIQKHLKMP